MFLYNLVIWIYNLFLLAAAPFNRKARLIVLGRRKTFRILRDKRKHGDRIIWFHCASLGEFEQGRPVMEALKNNKPHYRIFVSFFSSSGYEVKKSDTILDAVFYLPADTRLNAKKLISILKPEVAIFIKYEFWHHYFFACNRNKIPVVSISTILRPDQVFFRSFGKFYRSVLKRVDLYFVQNEETRELLNGIGIKNVRITGDTRFDRVFRIGSEHKHVPAIEKFMEGKPLVILGSTWQPDIKLWKEFINGNNGKYRFLIAPHNVDEADLRFIEAHFRPRSSRFSRIREDPETSSEILIIDTVGHLSSLYYYGFINYVGGSFSEGLHNILEPAVYGAPVLIGKDDSNSKFQEAVDLLAMGGAFEVSDPAGLESIMNKLSGDDHFYWDAGNKAKKYVESNLGATVKIVSELETILKKENGRAGI